MAKEVTWTNAKVGDIELGDYIRCNIVAKGEVVSIRPGYDTEVVLTVRQDVVMDFRQSLEKADFT